MDEQQVRERIASARQILLLLPMALGDFSYQQLIIAAFRRAYPEAVLDVMFDEAFHGNPLHRGGGQLVNPIICEWAADTGLFRHVYAEMYTGAALADVMAAARSVGYDAVISLAGRGRQQVAQAARAMAPQAVIIAWDLPGCWWRFGQDVRAYRATVDYTVAERHDVDHVTEMYARFFRAFATLPSLDWEDTPMLDVPTAAATHAAEVLAGYGATASTPIVFVNAFAKNRKRTWPLEHVAQLLRELRSAPPFADAVWLVNGMPGDREAVEAMIAREDLSRTYFFSATAGFWQLPAMLAAADLVISVETAVMHLASLLRRPQVVLMRQKTPYWRPLRRTDCTIVTTRRRRDHIAAITPQEVAAAVMRQMK